MKKSHYRLQTCLSGRQIKNYKLIAVFFICNLQPASRRFLLCVVVGWFAICNCFAQTDSIANDTCVVFTQNSLSPNADPPSDKLIIYHNCSFTDFDLTIYDRWGNVIYQTNTINNNTVDWNYEKLPASTYFYVLKCTLPYKEFSGTGYINLVK